MNLVENFVQGILFLPVLICKGVTPKTRKKHQRKQFPTHKYMQTKYSRLKKN